MSARLNNSTRRRIRAIAAGSAAGALVSISGATPMAFAATASAASDDNVDVVNTETVQVYMDAHTEIESKRVYEQLILSGKGSVDVENPVSKDGLRNLDGFSGFELKDGEQVARFDVDGVERARTVSDYKGKLPVDVDIAYKLDGKKVKPEDVVGKSGHLEVAITVKNITGETRELAVPDGKGGTITQAVDVPIPLAGSVEITTPTSFTEVESAQFARAGDGKGGYRLNGQLTLIPPVGSDKATLAYEADIEDGVVPKIEVSILPINPFANATLSGAADSYKGGADKGAALAAGATEIDTNLLKLRDGAGTLLAGLLQLHAGSQELQKGLSGKAAPGAQKLADGTVELKDGLGQLADGAGDLDAGLGKINDGAGRLDAGAGQLADGAGRLSAGTGDALSGSQQLQQGLGLISGGLGQLASGSGLPKAAAGVDQLKAGVDQLLAGFGAVGTAGTLLDGLNRLELGLGQLSGGLTQLRGDGSPATPGLVGAKGGVDQVQAGLSDAVKAGGSLDQLVGGLNLLKSLDCGPICDGVIDTQILPGVQDSKNKLSLANGGLLQVSGGLGQAITGLNSQLIPGANAAHTGAGDAKAGALQLKGGLSQVKAGLDDLDVGLTAAVAGILQLSAGANSAYAGSGDLTAGLGLLDAGAGTLADGAGTLADGADKLADGVGDAHDGSGRLADGAGDAFDGSGKIADGAGELSEGLDDAADGSGKLADGLGEAAKGAPQLVDGADRLSKEGTQAVVGQGSATAVDFGTRYATLKAGSERAEAESMAFGAPEGATGLTAYNFIIKGEDGEGGRNWARALGGIGLLAAGGGVFAYRRRLI